MHCNWVKVSEMTAKIQKQAKDLRMTLIIGIFYKSWIYRSDFNISILKVAPDTDLGF